MSNNLMSYGVNTNINGVNGFGRQYARANGNAIAIYTATVVNSNVTFTVPAYNSKGNLATDDLYILAIFSYQNPQTSPPGILFVAVNQAATPNTTNAFIAEGGAMMPSALLVRGGDVLNFYALGTPATCAFSVEFYTVT